MATVPLEAGESDWLLISHSQTTHPSGSPGPRASPLTPRHTAVFVPKCALRYSAIGVSLRYGHGAPILGSESANSCKNSLLHIERTLERTLLSSGYRLL
jgi:hypothetical protein